MSISQFLNNQDFAWIPTLIIFIFLIFSLFLADYLSKKNSYLKRRRTIYLVLAPFFILIAFLLPLILTKQDPLIILLASGIPFVIVVSFSFINLRLKLLEKHEQRMINYKKNYKREEEC